MIKIIIQNFIVLFIFMITTFSCVKNNNNTLKKLNKIGINLCKKIRSDYSCKYSINSKIIAYKDLYEKSCYIYIDFNNQKAYSPIFKRKVFKNISENESLKSIKRMLPYICSNKDNFNKYKNKRIYLIYITREKRIKASSSTLIDTSDFKTISTFLIDSQSFKKLYGIPKKIVWE